MFALRHIKTKKMLGFTAMSNEGDFCTSIEYSLCEYSDDVWVVPTLGIAKGVFENGSAPWYNAGFHTPSYSFDIQPYEIVELKVK